MKVVSLKAARACSKPARSGRGQHVDALTRLGLLVHVSAVTVKHGLQPTNAMSGSQMAPGLNMCKSSLHLLRLNTCHKGSQALGLSSNQQCLSPDAQPDKPSLIADRLAALQA